MYQYAHNKYFFYHLQMQSAYSHNIGVESADLFNEERTDWIRRRFESPGIQSLNKEEKRILMARLIRSTK